MELWQGLAITQGHFAKSRVVFWAEKIVDTRDHIEWLTPLPLVKQV
jgi:hypothetical protein